MRRHFLTRGYMLSRILLRTTQGVHEIISILFVSIVPFLTGEVKPLCVQHIYTLYNVCAVPWGCSVLWGVFSTMGGYHEYRGDIMSTVGDILSTVGGLQYRGGYLEYHGGVQYRGDIMSTVGVILSTVRDVQYREGIS